MKTIVAGIIGSFCTAGIFLILGMAVQQQTLTPAQLAVLNTMSIVNVRNGQGGQTPTLRIEKVDVQIVNGTGSSFTPNGVGNLVMGYNDLRLDDTDDRRGSHNIIAGIRNNYSKACGLNIGFENELHGDMASLLSTENSKSMAWCSNVTGGYINTSLGMWSCIIAGSYNYNEGMNASICGGELNRVYPGGLRAAISGGRLRNVYAQDNWAAGSLFQNN